MYPKVKICCISSPEEAQLAIDHGASALGLVGRMPSGPGVIEDSLIARIASTIPPTIATFLLTSEITAEDIIAHHYRTYTNTIQLVDALPLQAYGKIRRTLPNVKLVQAVHVLDESSVEWSMAVAEHVDAILLDSGNPTLAIKELGGTGRVHDWRISRKIRDAVNIPIFLAGGLNASNVRSAIDEVNPFGIDLCSGVRTSGKLDPEKLAQFFRAIYV